jgi:Carboxypeptidase regulatory-like domain
MTRLTTTALAVLFTAIAHAGAAQQPVRPAESPRTVTLSVTEYNRLIDLAARPPEASVAAPVAAVLSSADLRVRVDRESARGTFSVTGDVLRPGVARVGLLSGATLVDATAAGRPLPLIAEGTAHSALLPGPGPFALNLEWGAPLTFTPGRGSFVLPSPPAGTVRATIDLPSEQADVHLSSGLITRRTVNGGRTVVEATLTPGSATEVWWSMRDSAPTAAAREARTVADVMTLVTLGDSDVRMVALIDVTVVQGEPRTVSIQLPPGYELTSIAGGSLERSEQAGAAVTLTVADPAARRHQFLVSLERPHGGGSFTLDTGFVSVPEVQRERGEVAVEGIGTLELTTADRDGMHRIDVREIQPALQSLARQPVLSAFRYQRTAGTVPGLVLDARRFADAGVLAAYAERATATTLITAEGRALTEVVLKLQNRAQPFLKVQLPEGASIVSVEVAGEAAKPVLGADGVRVPLMRPGFRPNGSYSVSFVYLHAGAPFARKGDLQMSLPKMDVPVGEVEWEIFAPENYSLRTTGGNVIEQTAFDRSLVTFHSGTGSGGGAGTGTGTGTGVFSAVGPGMGGGLGAGVGGGTGGGTYRPGFGIASPGEIRGRVADASGAVLPGVTIELGVDEFRRSTTTDSSGTYVLSGVPDGKVTMTATLSGFETQRRQLSFDQRPVQVDFSLRGGSVTETVTVSGKTPQTATTFDVADSLKKSEESAQRLVEPSQNVINLQRRAAGVLPVRIDVPRAGTSHRFVRPLVVDQETVVALRYKRR